jgi:hypothetical protein
MKVLDSTRLRGIIAGSCVLGQRLTLDRVGRSQKTIRPVNIMKTERHGHSRNGRMSPTYSSYTAMLSRCCCPTCTAYPEYGGKGVTVCDRWRNSFLAFLSDMGERPLGTSLDRIDNEGHYDPWNCRWSTYKAQARNRRCVRMVTAEGRTMCLVEWAEFKGISLETIRARLRYGWSAEKAVSFPVDTKLSRKANRTM